MRHIAFIPCLLCAVACSQPPITLVTTGLGQELEGEGLWIVQTLEWGVGHPNASEPETVMHSFTLASDAPDCATVQLHWDGGPATDAYHDGLDAGVSGEALCELERAMYEERASQYWSAPGLTFESQLWNTVIDGDHIGVPPEDGITYTALDGPDADVVEHASRVRLQHDDYWGAVADGLDCTSTTPWGEGLPAAPDTEEGQLHGALTFTTSNRNVWIDFDADVYDSDAFDPDAVPAPSTAWGRLEGVARFERCEVSRVLEAPPLIH